MAGSTLRVWRRDRKIFDGKLDSLKHVKQDVKEMVADMQQRLLDLRNPAVSLSGLGPAGAPGESEDPLRGVLGSLLGESKADQAKRIQEATETANDLTGLVKHKKKPKFEDATAVEGRRLLQRMMDAEAAH